MTQSMSTPTPPDRWRSLEHDGLRFEVEVASPPGVPVASVIWLHGMGQDGSVMASVAAPLRLADSGVRAVFIGAPRRPVGIVSNAPVRAWFLQSVTSLHAADLRTLGQARVTLRAVVDEEVRRVGAARVLIAGFSQGAAMAVSLALHYPARLAGLALYAPFIVRDDLVEGMRSPATVGLPVWIGHGRRDWTVPITTGRAVRDTLRAWGYPVSWHSYRGAHVAFEDDSLASLGEFLAMVFR